MEKNDKVLHLHNDYVFQLFRKVLYATKNLRRRLILETFNGHKTRSDRDIQQYLREKGLLKDNRGYSKSKIRKNHLIPLIEARILEEQEGNLFRITSLGKNIEKIISGVKEFDILSIPTHQELYPERILLELREGRKTYSELKSKLNLLTPRGVIKRLRDVGFVKMKHPYNSLHVNSLSRFIVSSYYPFIQGVKAYTEKTGRSWFTEYSIAHYLSFRWKEKFGRGMDLEEARQLLEKGVGVGDIIKTNGSYTALIKDPIRGLRLPGRKIFDLIQEGYDSIPTMAEKSGLPLTSIYKILERLKKKNLIEAHKEYVTIELTEKGKKLADCLLKIRKCVTHYIYPPKSHRKKLSYKEELRLKAEMKMRQSLSSAY